jgi:hypothetical protein
MLSASSSGWPVVGSAARRAGTVCWAAGVCPGPAGRGAQRCAAAVVGALPAVQGHPCVVAGDGAIAQSVCGGTHLGCAGRTMLLEGRLPESWIPPAHMVEMRTLGRLYCALMDERRAWQQRIHAQLFYRGWPPFGRRCRRQGATRSRVPSCRRWGVSMWIPRCGALVSSAPRSIAANTIGQFRQHQAGCRALRLVHQEPDWAADSV